MRKPEAPKPGDLYHPPGFVRIPPFALGYVAGFMTSLIIIFFGIVRISVQEPPAATPIPTAAPTSTAHICPEIPDPCEPCPLRPVLYKSAPDVAEVHSDLILVSTYLDLAMRSGDYDLALVHMRESMFHLISAGERVEGIMRLGEYPCP
jgi:hypothetical protein